MHKFECPYCKYGNSINCLEDDNFDHECEGCEKEFEVNIEYDPIICTSEIEYRICIDCKKEYRFTGQSFPRPEIYKNIDLKEYYVCPACFHRETIKEL